MTADIGGSRLDGAARQEFLALRVTFTVAPILFGLDKFVDRMVGWPDYLAGWIDDIVPGTAQELMYLVGAVEIAAGLLVLVAPWIAASWWPRGSGAAA